MVVNGSRVKVKLRELVYQEIQSFVLVEFLHQWGDGEVLNDIKDILGVPLNIVIEVHQHIVRVTLESCEVVVGVIEKLESDLFPYDGFRVQLTFVLLIQLVYLGLPWFEDTVQSSHHHEGENHTTVFTGFEETTQNVISR